MCEGMQRFLQPGAVLRPIVVAKAKAKGRPKTDVSDEAMSIEKTRARSRQSAQTDELLQRVATADQRLSQLQDTVTALSLQH